MFTGLVSAVGEVLALTDESGQCCIACPPNWLDGSKVGESIAVNGACLTITALDDLQFSCTLSDETRAHTAPLAAGARVNLEQALALGDKLGGHFVSGHIDGIAQVTACTADAAGGLTLELQVPPPLLPLLAQKGSVALAGVSLTINRLTAQGFEVYLLPHTLAYTNLQDYPAGSAINMETDLLARHVARLLNTPAP